MKSYLMFFFLLQVGLFALTAAAQSEKDDSLPGGEKNELGAALPMQVEVGKALYKGDSIPHIILPTLYKYPPMNFKDDKERANFTRLVYNVKLLLPYAKAVKITILETSEVLNTMPTKEERQAHIDRVEAGLKKEYTPFLKKLTTSQGKLLIKLIDRECNQTGLQIARAFIGYFKANLYQAFSFLFGLNLNKHYDPEGDDRYTERVVRMVESGQI